MIPERDTAPIPRFRVLEDKDSNEFYLGEWLPSLYEDKHYFLVRGPWPDEEMVRETIKEILYN